VEEYKHYAIADKVIKILVGNKSDLTEAKRVQSSVAKKFAEEYGMPFFEVSSKSDEDKQNIEKIFSSIAEKLHKEKPVVLKRASVLEKTHTLQSQDSEKNVTLKNDKEKLDREKKKCCGSGSS
jgi:GTPase SAR1 family protein